MPVLSASRLSGPPRRRQGGCTFRVVCLRHSLEESGTGQSSPTKAQQAGDPPGGLPERQLEQRLDRQANPGRFTALIISRHIGMLLIGGKRGRLAVVAFRGNFMKLSSRLPLSPMFFKHWHTDDTEIGVVIAKARFIRREIGEGLRAAAAPELAMQDLFEGDPACTSPVVEQDLAPGKIGTDLMIRATARAPGRRALSDWPVSVDIPERLHYGFQVRGPSFWRRGRLAGWERTAPELVDEVPLSYALAYGGSAPGPDGATVVCEANPAGIGLVTRERLQADQPIPVPQIGALAEFMVTDPLAPMTVHGLGPLGKAWLPRRAHAGTFDADWQATRHPRMPRDYSLRFWNAAPGPMQLNPPLRGNEEIVVTGIAQTPVRLRLPGVWCAIDMQGDAVERLEMVLDTVTLDLQDEDPRAHSAMLTWRAQVPAPHRFAQGEVISGRLEG